MKKIAAIVMLLVLAGCASKSNFQFKTDMKAIDFGSLIMQKHPEISYCFDLPAHEARNSINEFWRANIDTTPLSGDKVYSWNGGDFGNDVGMRTQMDYIRKYKNNYMKGDISYDQRLQCIKTFSDKESRIALGMK